MDGSVVRCQILLEVVAGEEMKAEHAESEEQSNMRQRTCSSDSKQEEEKVLTIPKCRSRSKLVNMLTFSKHKSPHMKSPRALAILYNNHAEIAKLLIEDGAGIYEVHVHYGNKQHDCSALQCVLLVNMRNNKEMRVLMLLHDQDTDTVLQADIGVSILGQTDLYQN